MITDIIRDNGASICVIVIGCVLLLVTAVRMSKRYAGRKELKRLAEDRKREEALDHVLCNEKSGRQSQSSQSIPYEVDYAQSGKKIPLTGNKNNGQIMVQVIEHNELSVRKHIMSLDNIIHIGSQSMGESIIVAGTAPCQCEIFSYKGEVYIRDVGENKLTVLKRKKKQVYVAQNGIRLQTGDEIILGKVSFHITIIK